MRKRKAREKRRTASTREKSRGRLEHRTLTATTVGTDTCDWPGVRQFLKLERTTSVKGETKTSVSYAITSHTVKTSTPHGLLRLWRSRWSIENRLFWVKDVVMREDHCRIRTANAAYAMSVIRNAIINSIRASGIQTIQAELRANALKVNDLLTKLGILN